MARTMEDLYDFFNIANITLARRDNYLDHLNATIMHDTLAALRTAPIHLSYFLPHGPTGLSGYGFHSWCPDGQAGGQKAGNVCLGCISETVRYRKLIIGSNIG